MIIFNNKEYNSFKELREKYNLVSEREVTRACNCWFKTVRTASQKNNIKSYSVIANGLNCFVYDEKIIDLINSKKTRGEEVIPSNYILRTDLAKYLGISLSTLNDIEFWSKTFKEHRKTIIVKGATKLCYEFTPEAKDFYSKKLNKWKHPDRTKCTCYEY